MACDSAVRRSQTHLQNPVDSRPSLWRAQNSADHFIPAPCQDKSPSGTHHCSAAHPVSPGSLFISGWDRRHACLPPRNRSGEAIAPRREIQTIPYSKMPHYWGFSGWPNRASKAAPVCHLSDLCAKLCWPYAIPAVQPD